MKLNRYLWSFFILFIIGGCENLEETYSDYTGNGTIRYLGKCKDLSVSPGWQRLIVKWTNPVDPAIDKIKVSWTLDGVTRDSLLEKGTTECSIRNLKNGTYEVSVQNVDKAGNCSLPVLDYKRPYTLEHENIISFTRLFDKHFWMKDRLVLFFGEWQKNIETASLNYYSGGELKEQKLDSVFITNNKYYLIPDKIDAETKVVINRSGRLAGCSDLIVFNPYELTRENKIYTPDFKQLLKEKYGQSEITETFEEMGIESINVSIQDRSATKEVKPEEMEQLAEEHSDIIAGQSPTVSMPAFIKNGSDTISTQATGVNEYYLGMKKYNITYGRELTYVDVERKQKVCVIGTYIAKEVFGGDALGKSIQITGTPYEVVGILEEQDDSTENSSDNCVYIPYTLASYTNRTSTVSSYVVYAVDQEKVEEAVLLLEALCDKDIGDSDYYTVTSMKSMADSVTDILDKMELMLIAIAAISLVVAGIGIMNIMLVSVTERTKEIGIRKAIGAGRYTIMLQFLIEAMMLSLMGCFTGVAASWGTLKILSVAASAYSLNFELSIGVVWIAIIFSTVIGVVFGLYPAHKAAKKNPIESLRYTG